jgi:hypothetical protein
LALFIIGSVHGQTTKRDVFMGEIRDIINNIPEGKAGSYISPSEADIQQWNSVFRLFHGRAVDSCRTILTDYNYELIQIVDSYTGDVYDVIREREPIERGWGTFIYNQSFKKKVNVHVTHPVEDWSTSVIGAELFRRVRGQWLFIAGSRKTVSDIGKLQSTIFQQFHEILIDPTTITLSLHGYNSVTYGDPIASADIIIGNGRTSDNQWGISQLSLSIRDSITAAGYPCALAMYDSGCARLAGGNNIQGIRSNDKVGFGRWLNIEISERVRGVPFKYSRVISVLDRNLQILANKSSKQLNKAFALVSPRVVKIDSFRKMMFPPAQSDSYRVISFNASANGNDSMTVRFGSWLNFGDARTVTRVTALDTSSETLAEEIHRFHRAGSGMKSTRLIQRPATPVQSPERIAGTMISDSASGEDDPSAKEPLQVHKIPLQPVLLSTVSNEYTSASTPFKWEGAVNNLFIPGMRTMQARADRSVMNDLRGIPSFLIPLISSSYDGDNRKFVGVHMTSILVNEIARLVNEHDLNVDDVELYAEESETGDYYLRIFPSMPSDMDIVQNP